MIFREEFHVKADTNSVRRERCLAARRPASHGRRSCRSGFRRRAGPGPRSRPRARSRRRLATSAAAARRRLISLTPTFSPSTRSFNGLAQPNSAIQRLWTGALWSEGPAWNAQGRYLVLSDIPNNRQLRWLEDDGRVTRVPRSVEQQQRQHLRLPGTPALLRTSDAAGRALRARRLGHGARRFLSGQAAELAERRRPAPRRQLLVHRPALWRPALRGRARRKRAARATPSGRLNPKLGQAAGHRRMASANCRRTATASIRAAGSTSSSPKTRFRTPMGCASRRTSRSSTSPAPARARATRAPAARATSTSSTSAATTRLSNRKVFSDCMVDGVKCGPDGLRCDVDGNLWASSNAGRSVGYSGVIVFNPDGKAHRAHPPAGNLRQHLLRRTEAQPPVHGRRASLSTPCSSTRRGQRQASRRSQFGKAAFWAAFRAKDP